MKAKTSTLSTFNKRPKVSRPGVHAKTKQSRGKGSRNYKKPYRGQGKQLHDLQNVVIFVKFKHSLLWPKIKKPNLHQILRQYY